jgi:acetyl-CoA C-acetyltransferase
MRFGSRMGNAAAVDSLLIDGLHDAFSTRHSGWHTEDLVQKHGLTREAQDAFATQSQQRFAAARAAGWFKDEIEWLILEGKKGQVTFSADEGNRWTALVGRSGRRPLRSQRSVCRHCHGRARPTRDRSVTLQR